MVKYRPVASVILSTVLFFAGGYYIGRKLGNDIFEKTVEVIESAKNIELD